MTEEEVKNLCFEVKNWYEDVLKEFEIEFHIEKKFGELLLLKDEIKTFTHYKDLDPSFDVMLTIGGDGTFLRAVTFIRDLDIPILGINMGRLGYLATTNREDIKRAIDMFFAGDYKLDKRELISLKTDDNRFGNKNFALDGMFT